MTWIGRPLTPPLALMSSAAIAAALVREAPATDDSSPMTPILMGSGACGENPSPKLTATPSAMPLRIRRCARACFDSVIGVLLLATAKALVAWHVRPHRWVSQRRRGAPFSSNSFGWQWQHRDNVGLSEFVQQFDPHRPYQSFFFSIC